MIDCRMKRAAGWAIIIALLVTFWPNVPAGGRGSVPSAFAGKGGAPENGDCARHAVCGGETAEGAASGGAVSGGQAPGDDVSGEAAADGAADGDAADSGDAWGYAAASSETAERRVPVSLKAMSFIDPKELYARLAAGDPTGGVLSEEGRYAEPEQPTVYLTFDDGPSELTPQVLDILAEYGVPATFFVLGELAEKREEIIRRILREGHAIGNHTYNHDYQELYGNFEHFYAQVERTGEILERISGQRVKLLRAPGGTATNFDAFYFYYLTIAGYLVHDWNVDSGDSKRRHVPASEIVANVKRARLTREMNVLLHDGAGHEETVKALPEIIEYFQEQGYRFAALTDEVKPIVFRVGKVKWNRNTDEREHERLLALVKSGPARTGGAGHADGVLVAAAEEPASVAITSSGKARAAEEPAAGRAEASGLAPGKVPLREWAKRFGAAVAWEPERGTATLSLGGASLEWSVREGAGWLIAADGAREPLHFELTLHENRLYASADALDQLFAGTMPHVAATESFIGKGA